MSPFSPGLDFIVTSLGSRCRLKNGFVGPTFILKAFLSHVASPSLHIARCGRLTISSFAALVSGVIHHTRQKKETKPSRIDLVTRYLRELHHTR